MIGWRKIHTITESLSEIMHFVDVKIMYGKRISSNADTILPITENEELLSAPEQRLGTFDQ